MRRRSSSRPVLEIILNTVSYKNSGKIRPSVVSSLSPRISLNVPFVNVPDLDERATPCLLSGKLQLVVKFYVARTLFPQLHNAPFPMTKSDIYVTPRRLMTSSSPTWARCEQTLVKITRSFDFAWKLLQKTFRWKYNHVHNHCRDCETKPRQRAVHVRLDCAWQLLVLSWGKHWSSHHCRRTVVGAKVRVLTTARDVAEREIKESLLMLYFSFTAPNPAININTSCEIINHLSSQHWFPKLLSLHNHIHCTRVHVQEVVYKGCF